MGNDPARKSIRYRPDNSETVIFEVDGEEFMGIPLNNSYSGNCFVCCYAKLAKEQDVSVKVGEQAPLPARVVWVKELDEDIQKVGVEFKE